MAKLILFTIESVNASAMVTVGWSASVTSGVDSLSVNFTDESVPDGTTITGWSWERRITGTPTYVPFSTVQNPSSISFEVGTWDINLVTTYSGGTAELARLSHIVVTASPLPSIPVLTNITPIPVPSTRLHAGIFDLGQVNQANLTAANKLEELEGVEDISVRWSLRGYGIERIECIVPVQNRSEIAYRQNNHLSKRLAIYDSAIYRPMSGYITGVEPMGDSRVKYIAKGPAWRLDDETGITAAYTEATTTSALLETFLDDHNKIISDDFGGIEETNTPIGSWRHAEGSIGTLITEYLKFMLPASDANGGVWDFWIEDLPFKISQLLDYKARLRNRANYTDVDWVVYRDDLQDYRQPLEMYDYASSAAIFYGGLQSTATGGSSTQLQDSAVNFEDGSFSEGDKVINITDGSESKITAIGANLTISPLSGGTDDTFQNGDKYSIERLKFSNFAFTQVTDLADHNDFYPWVRRYAEHRPDLDATQAAQRSKAMFRDKNKPKQTTSSLVIKAPFILDANGVRHPLYKIIEEGGGVLKIADQFPRLRGSIRDTETTYWITAADYSQSSQSIRLTLDIPDPRLDVKLAEAGIINSPTIDKGNPIRTIMPVPMGAKRR